MFFKEQVAAGITHQDIGEEKKIKTSAAFLYTVIPKTKTLDMLNTFTAEIVRKNQPTHTKNKMLSSRMTHRRVF